MFRRRTGADAPRTRIVAAALAALVAAAVCVCAPAQAYAATALTGTFTLTPGSCGGGAATGTYLRMILPSGGPSGPFMSNSDSTCGDQSYTPLAPGSDGGLISGGYQATPTPAFDASGNARAGRITAPVAFYGTSFATSSNPVDPQTHAAVGAPQVWANGSSLTADLRAFSVTWNNQYFNQGAPKPDGSLPGNTRAATGTYDAATGAFTLQWTSQVVGGPFDKFTGLWHLTGRFVPASGGRAAAAPARPAVAAPSASRSTAAAPAAAGQAAVRPAAAATTTRVSGAAHASSSAAHGSSSSSSAAAAPAAAASGQPPGGQQVAAATTTITQDRWQVSWWVLALVAAIAVAGIIALVAVTRATRRAAVTS